MIDAICRSFAPSGQEEKMRKLLEKQMTEIFESVETDNLGNLVCKSGDAKLFIECGMDTSGIMIVSKEEGKAFFTGVGGVTPEYLLGKKILFEDGNFGIVRCEKEDLSKMKISDLYLEADTRDLKIGDFGVVKAEYCENSEKMMANGLADRIGLAAVVQALKTSENPKNLGVLFSAQKRIGAKGLQAFFGVENAQKVITVDSINLEDNKKRGCALVISDKTSVCDTKYKDELLKIINDKGVNAYLKVTDENLYMGNIKTTKDGKMCIGVGIGVMHKGKNFESVNKADFEACVSLLKAVIEEA